MPLHLNADCLLLACAITMTQQLWEHAVRQQPASKKVWRCSSAHPSRAGRSVWQRLHNLEGRGRELPQVKAKGEMEFPLPRRTSPRNLISPLTMSVCQPDSSLAQVVPCVDCSQLGECIVHFATSDTASRPGAEHA